MKRTATDDASEVILGRASGYTPHPGAPTGFDNASFISMSFPGGAGCIRSTAEDLCRWQRALLGGRVLKAESLRAMTTPGRLSNGAMPTTPSGAVKGSPRTPVEYGFGLFIHRTDGRLTYSHDGGIQGFLSEIRTWPESETSIALLVNCDGGFGVPTGLKAAMAAIGAEALKITDA